MTAFDTAIDDLHSDEDLSVAVSFRRPPYTWQSVRAILSKDADAFGVARAGRLIAEVRAASLADIPQRGDQVRIDGTVYAVDDAERDVLALTYRLTLADHT
jgi:hypothetical protein